MKIKSFLLPSSCPKQTHTHKKYRLLFTWALIGLTSLSSIAQTTFTWDEGPTGHNSNIDTAISTIGGQSLRVTASNPTTFFHGNIGIGPFKDGTSGFIVMSEYSTTQILTFTFDGDGDGLYGDPFTLNSLILGDYSRWTYNTFRLRPNGVDANGEDHADDDPLNYQPFVPTNAANFTNITSLDIINPTGKNLYIVVDDVTVTGTPINTAPTSVDNILTTNEDSPIPVATSDVGYSDSDGDPLDHITLTSLPSAGTLFLDANGNDMYNDGEEVNLNDQVSKTNLDANTLYFLPDADENGLSYAAFDFLVNDGTDDATSVNTITFNVSEVNDAPSFVKGSDQSVLEGAGAQTVNGWATALDKGASNESGQVLSFSVSNDNNAIFSVQPSIDASGNLTFTPSSNAYGVATVSVDLSDNGGTANGGDDSFSTQTFTITIRPQLAFSIDDVSENEGNTLSFTVSLNHGAPAGGATIDYASDDGTAIGGSDYTAVFGTLSFSTGERTKTVEVSTSSDNMLEADETFILSLSSPTGTEVAIGDGTGIGTLMNDDAAALTLADVSGNEDEGTITVTASLDHAVQGGVTVDVNTTDGTAETGDSDYSAISSQTLSFTGNAGEIQTFTLTPTSDGKLESDEQLTVFMNNLSGTTLAVDITDGATVTILNDDTASVTIEDVSGNEDDGSIMVTAILDNPVQGGFTVDVSIADGTATIADSDYTALNSHTLSFTGDGGEIHTIFLPPNSHRKQKATGETQTFTFLPLADGKVEPNETVLIGQSNLGQTTLPVDITDGATASIINDDHAPFISAGQHFLVNEHAEEGSLIGAVMAEDLDEGTTFSNWKITAGNDSGYFVLDKVSGELRLGAVANTDFEIMDSFPLSLTVSDGSNSSAEETVTIIVIPVNDKPSFTVGPDETIQEDAGQQTVLAWATEIDKGASNEREQSLTFTLTNDNNSLFGVQPQIDSSGTLSYTPAANANGVAEVSIVLSDNGGTDYGGDDTYAPQAFTITVEAINDVPQFTLRDDPPVIMENDSAQTITDFITEITPGGGEDEAEQALLFTVSPTGKSGNLSFDEAPAISPEGVLTYTPSALTSGTATFEVTLSDDGNPAASSEVQSFILTVNDLPNNAPTVVQPVADQLWGVGFGSTSMDLSGVFQDSDGDTLFLSAYSEQEDIVEVSISGHLLTIREVGVGTSKITVIARDLDGMTIQTVFLVTVEVVLSAIPAIEKELVLYPNPTKDRVFLEAMDTPIQSVAVYDAFGKYIAGKATRVHNRWEVDLQDLGRGVYLLQVAIKDQLIFRQVLRE